MHFVVPKLLLVPIAHGFVQNVWTGFAIYRPQEKTRHHHSSLYVSTFPFTSFRPLPFGLKSYLGSTDSTRTETFCTSLLTAWVHCSMTSPPSPVLHRCVDILKSFQAMITWIYHSRVRVLNRSTLKLVLYLSSPGWPVRSAASTVPVGLLRGERFEEKKSIGRIPT